MRINYELIRSKMAEKEVTGQALAAILGIHQNSAYAKLRGYVPFTVEELAKFATQFGVGVNDLVIIGTSQKSPTTRI